MPQQNSRGSVGRVLLIIFATIGVLSMLTFASCVALVSMGISSVSKSFSRTNPSTTVSMPVNGKGGVFTTPRKNIPYVAGIKFADEINSEFADDIIAKLRYAQHDPSAIGILIDVNSPGGVVVPSQEIYDVINEIVHTKPVVSHVRSMAASGAYYSIVPSSEIIAGRGSIIGSIGVIMQGFEVNELLKFLKVQPTTLKSGSLKDAGSPYRAMTIEDKAYLKGLIDQIFAIFIDDIKKVRPAIAQKDLAFMSDGRVILAEQAKQIKLIDEIGSKEFAKKEVLRMANAKGDPDLFYYEDIKPLSDFFTDKLISGSSKVVKEILITNPNIPKF